MSKYYCISVLTYTIIMVSFFAGHSYALQKYKEYKIFLIFTIVCVYYLWYYTYWLLEKIK